MPPPRRAYAKLNLALAVSPPLPSSDPHAGMHPIASWMHAIELFDEVELSPATDGRSRYDIRWASDAPRADPIDWPLEKDLAVRAHRLLETRAGRSLPVNMRLTKRIPIGGGLGGGSSDAAAVLLLLNRAFALGLPLPELADLGRRLGSDVPFFLDDEDPPRPALVSGLGDRLERTPAATADIVLILPPFGCPTGAVYKAFDALDPGEPRDQEAAAQARAADPLNAPLFNDLIPAAEAVRPELLDFRERAAAASGRGVFMSGSGSTLFALATDARDAERTAERIREQVAGAVTLVTCLAAPQPAPPPPVPPLHQDKPVQ